MNEPEIMHSALGRTIRFSDTTTRDLLAAACAIGMIGYDSTRFTAEMAKYAYDFADALMTERAQRDVNK